MRALDAVCRWLAPSLLAATMGLAGAIAPTPVQAQDDLGRVLVDIADVVFQSGVPYYRYGHYGQYDRLVVQRDRYGRPVYYRYVPHGDVVGHAPPYAHGRDDDRHDNVQCNKHGKCKVTHYDGRYDRDHGWWDGRHWHDD